MHNMLVVLREVYFLNPSWSSRMAPSQLPGEKRKKKQKQVMSYLDVGKAALGNIM